MAMIEITQHNYEEEVLQTDMPVIIDFWATWCGPCQMLLPVVEQLAEEVNDIKICKVNVDEQQDLAMKFRVMSVPTLVVMKDGKETNRSIGVISKEEILSLV